MSLDALACLALLAFQIGSHAVTGLCQPTKQRRLVFIVFSVALLYPLGELLQEFSMIPEAIRWHLSNFGYVPYQALSVYTFYTIYRMLKDKIATRMADYFASTCEVRKHIILAVAVLCSVTVYELFVDETDMIDVVMYFAGAAIAVTIYTKLWTNVHSARSIKVAPSIAG